MAALTGLQSLITAKIPEAIMMQDVWLNLGAY
jgi:hypothetical protein